MIDFITWYGQASTKLTGEKIIYIDPFEMNNDDYEAADIILVTHDHFDHCSLADIQKVSGNSTTIIAPPNCSSKLSGDIKSITPDETIVEQGIQIEAVPAYNLGKTFHPKTSGGLGYIVTLNGKRIYQAGDTDFIPEMENIKADIVILPVGGTYTMNAEEAAKAANIIKPETAIPIHFGSIVGSQKDAENFKRLAGVPVIILSPSS